MSKEIYKNYICEVPFVNLEIRPKQRFLCCNGWLKKYLPDESSPVDAWNSQEAQDIRESILDGSYKYCDDNWCPYLNSIKQHGKPVRSDETSKAGTVVLHERDNLPSKFKSILDKYYKGTLTPHIIQFSFDESCNLKCPTCRVKIITANSRKIQEIQATIDTIEKQYGKTTKKLYITGSGDPFVSVGFRNFLRNFDSKKWPVLEHIHLHTNATKWNKKMWESMPNVQHLIKTCEISIDAGTKDTYEEKTRLGGDWKELLDNLNFISTIESLNWVKTSFVVQQKNYKEMKTFYDIMKKIFGSKVNIFYGRLSNWGTFSDEEFFKEEIHNINHPEHEQFLGEIQSLLPAKNAWTNLNEFINKTNKII